MSRGSRKESKSAVDSRRGEVAIFELDDVSSGDDLASARSEDGGAQHNGQECEGDEVETHLEWLSMKNPEIRSEGRWYGQMIEVTVAWASWGDADGPYIVVVPESPQSEWAAKSDTPSRTD